jgi:hypothetical protein
LSAVFYGVQMLFDYVHHVNSLSEGSFAVGISTIPASINICLILVDENNLDYFVD